MPAKSKSQQRLFSMALAVRKGDLPRSKVWKAVLDIVDSDMTNKEIEDFTVLKEGMRPLSEYMMEAMKKLGSGEEGTVYDMGDGRVKKVFKRNVPIAYQLLKSATDMGVIYALPKVYEVGEDYIIRENCTPNTPKCKEYYKLSQTSPWVGHDSAMRLVLDGHYWYDAKHDRVGTNIRGVIRGKMLDVIDWLACLKYEIEQICGKTAGLGDFAEKNLGETQDGRVVLMDF